MRSIMHGTGRIVLAFLFLLFAALPAQAEEYDALKGADSIRAVFDVRAGAPKSAAVQLDLILRTYTDSQIRAVSNQPEFVVVFIGPAVKLVTADPRGFAPEEREHLDNIAKTVKEMAAAGIRLEICMYAARLMGVEPAAVLPEIRQVENGWISLIGYQGRGFSLVPAY